MTKAKNRVISIRARRAMFTSHYRGTFFNTTRGVSYDSFPKNTANRQDPQARRRAAREAMLAEA